MKRYLYGKKMFIADLILVSVWGLFVSNYCSPGLMLLIPIRIALCFQMERRTPWTIISAIGFFLAYISADCFNKLFERMSYLFFCAIGESETMVDFFSKSLGWKMHTWLGLVSLIGFLWLAVMPLIVGLRRDAFKKIQWKSKWIWIYLIPLSALCLWVMTHHVEVGGFLLGLVVAILPAVYWCIYNRRERSPIQLIINDSKARWYIFFATYMLAIITIGLRDIYSLKLIGLLLFPALFYIMLTSSLQLGTVLTRCCVALSASGLLYWFTFDYGKTASIVMLVVAIALIIYAGVTMIITTKRYLPALTLIIIVTSVIIPFTLGMNPYILLDSDHTRMYVSNPSVRQGVYVVERYVELGEKGTPYYWCRKIGLRDRYSVILPMDYDELKTIDEHGRFIAPNKPIRHGFLKSEQRYGIFDLKHRKFIVNPEKMEVMEIERIDYESFKLINPEGIHFATFYLPGMYHGEYSPDARIELVSPK